VEIDGASIKHQRRYNQFTFDPNKFNLLESYSGVVSLKIDNRNMDPSGPGEDPGDGSAPINPNDIEIRKKIDGEDPEDPKSTETCRDEKDSLYLNVGSFGSFGSAPSPDAGLVGSAPGSSPGSAPIRVLRFLHAVPAFMGIDMRQYGPFQREDVGTVPTINAKSLVAKGFAAEIILGRAQAT
jgi:hypothetical protein